MHFFEKRLRYKVFRTLISVRFLRRMDDMAQEDRIRLIQDFGSIGPQLYAQHNQRVRDMVPKERLLEYKVKEGWEPLCAFLGVEVPDEPLPRLNESDSIKAVYFGQQVFGACVWTFWFGLIGCGVYIARNPGILRSLDDLAFDWLKRSPR